MGVPDIFSRTVIEIDGVIYNVAVADTPEETSQGLMNVTDLAPLEGMLFVYSSERVVTHWMKDTLIPLDIAWFDELGNFVSATSMSTCLDGACALYGSGAPARYAVEVPLGNFAGLSQDATLVLPVGIGSGKEI